MLTLQYRTAPWTYIGTTNVWYNGQVKSADPFTFFRSAFSEILAAYYRITYEDINGNQHRIGGVNFFFDVVDGTMQIDDKKSSVNPEEATVLYWILRALKATSVYNIPKDILDQKTTCRFVGIPSPTRAE